MKDMDHKHSSKNLPLPPFSKEGRSLNAQPLEKITFYC